MNLLEDVLNKDLKTVKEQVADLRIKFNNDLTKITEIATKQCKIMDFFEKKYNTELKFTRVEIYQLCKKNKFSVRAIKASFMEEIKKRKVDKQIQKPVTEEYFDDDCSDDAELNVIPVNNADPQSFLTICQKKIFQYN